MRVCQFRHFGTGNPGQELSGLTVTPMFADAADRVKPEPPQASGEIPPSSVSVWQEILEHRAGIEPANAGFADLSVSHFATGALLQLPFNNKRSS